MNRVTKYLLVVTAFFLCCGLPGVLFAGEGDNNEDPLKRQSLIERLQQFTGSSILLQPAMSESLSLVITELYEVRANRKNNIAFARNIFNVAHKRLFKRYRQFSTVSATLRAGDYDCVSASALLAILYQEFDFQFEIYETDYHVFLILNSDGHRILLESTDPRKGFVDHTIEINQRLRRYRHDQSGQGTRSERQVTLSQLAGLQHYNRAIYYFNNQRRGNALALVEVALQYYPSDRITAFHNLLATR